MVLAEPVLVGREKELEKLQRSLDSAFSGRGITIFISGKAGSGKTRLINEFLKIAKKREITILSGWCLSNAIFPYFPFIEAFSSDLSNRENRTIVRQQLSVRSWLSEPYPTEKLEKNQPVAPQVWKDQAFSSVTRELLFMSSVKPLILVLEDMHWADSASLALLHYISRAIVNERVLVLATCRSEELSSKSQGRPHPLVETIHLMGREGLFNEIKLTNLNQDCVRRIAESILGGNVDMEFIQKLLEESRGNPLFVVEFVRMLSERGSLVREQDQWRLSVDKFDVPSKVRDVILRRISALKPNQRKILDVASVIGDKFNPDLISGVLSKERLEILELLNEILQSTSLVSVEKDCYRFYHTKSREVLYDKLPLPLKQGYHERIAQQIEIASQDGEEISQSDLAYHYAQAGNKEKSVKYGLAAGQDALAKFSNTEAIKHFTYVLQTIANLQKCNGIRSVALEGLGDAYYANCMFEEAIKCFDSLANSEAGIVKLRAYRKKMDAVWYRDNDATRLMQLVKEAENYVASDSLERGRILWNRGRGLLRLGDLKAALKDHEKALRILEEEYSLPDVAQLLAGTGVTRIMCDIDPKKGLSELQRSVSIYRELGDIRGEIMATILRNTGFIFCGLVQELDGAYTNVLRMGEEIGDFEKLVTAYLYTGLLLEVVPPSRFKEAIAQNLKALEYSRKTDSQGIQTRIYAGLTREYARIGDLENADYYFGMLMKLPPEILSRQRNFYFIALTEAVLFAAKGKWKEANQCFGRVFELLKIGFYHHINFEILYKSNYAWALDMQGRTEEAKVQRAENYKTLAKIEERFGHADLQASLMMRRKVVVGEEFEMRLEMVNISRRSCSIVKVEAVVPSEGFEVTNLPSYCCLQNGDIELEKRTIGAFEVQTIKLGFKATKAGVLNLNPEILYVDDLGKTKTCKPNSIRINVKPALSSLKEKEFAETLPVKLEFRSEAAQKAFDFLINAFVEDYFRRKLPKERSGWRTLMEIVKQAKVSQYSMYGSGGGRGLAATELERLGVVEVRVFFGERGRGGKVLKFRVSSEKENVKHFIDQRI